MRYMLIVAALFATTAPAVGESHDSVAGWYQPNVPCTCRYRGRDFRLGESICINSGRGLQVARCEMSLNNTSWKFTDTACPLTAAPAGDTAG